MAESSFGRAADAHHCNSEAKSTPLEEHALRLIKTEQSLHIYRVPRVAILVHDRHQKAVRTIDISN